MTPSILGLATCYRSYLEEKKVPPEELVDQVIQECIDRYVRPGWVEEEFVVNIPHYVGYQTILLMLRHLLLSKKLTGILEEQMRAMTPHSVSSFSLDVQCFIDELLRELNEQEKPYLLSDVEALLKQLGEENQYLIVRILQDKRIRRLAQVVFAGSSKEECQRLVTNPTSYFRFVMLYHQYFSEPPEEIWRAIQSKGHILIPLEAILIHASRRRHPIALLDWLASQQGDVKKNACYLGQDDDPEVLLPMMMQLSDDLWNKAAQLKEHCQQKLSSPALPFVIVSILGDTPALSDIIDCLIKEGDSPQNLLEIKEEKRISYLQGLQTQRNPVLQGT